MSKWIEDVISKQYRPPNAGRAARRQVFILAGTALITLAALAAEGWLMWLLWAWVAYRAGALVVLAAIGPQLVEAWHTRWDGLPVMWRKYLTGEATLRETR